MRFPAAFDDWHGVTEAVKDDLAKVVTGTMDDVTRGFTGDLREMVVASGLGQRLANTWRGKRYPDRAAASVDAAAYVYSRAPEIIDAFSRGATITPVNGRRYLAIPTENVPNRRRGDGGSGTKMSPEQVELQFNQDLHFAKAGNGRLVAYVNVVGAKNKKGFRRATPTRIAQGRQVAAVVMFIMVPIVRMPRLIDPYASFASWVNRVPEMISTRWSAIT